MKNILIVDDNQMIRESLYYYLGSELKDYQVLTAEDGEKAIEALKANPVSLVLTDLEMPNVDGYQVITYVKRNHPSVPVIVMTGSWSLDLEALVRKTGVVRCIEKPFHFDELSRMASEALGHGTEASAPKIKDASLALPTGLSALDIVC
jgi:two-component system response regulator FlrC